MTDGTPVTKNLEENEVWFRSRCEGCSDIKLQPMRLGKDGSVSALAIYVENTVPNLILEESVLGRMFIDMAGKDPKEVYQAVEANSLGLSEAQPLQTREEGMNAMLAGNLLLLVEGYDKGLKIGSKGYPARSVDNTDTEKVLRGSNEGFTESVKTNTALIRKRIRSTDMKVEELTAGVRSNTRLVLVYMKELVYPEVLEQIRRGIDQFVIDGVLDSGIIEHPHCFLAIRASQRIEEFHHIIKCNACTCGRSAVFRTACSIKNTGRFALAITNEERLFFLRTDSSCKLLCNVGRQVKNRIIQKFF